MRRYGTLLIVLVLATASLLAAAAMNSALVANAASVTVVNTDAALLALTAGDGAGHTNDPIFSVVNGMMVLKFGKGDGTWPSSGDGGLQRNSVYEWQNVFMIRSQSLDLLKFRVDLYETYDVETDTGSLYTGPCEITISEDIAEGGGVVFVDQNGNTANWDTNEPTDFNKGIDFKVYTPAGATMGLDNFVVVVRAVKR